MFDKEHIETILMAVNPNHLHVEEGSKGGSPRLYPSANIKLICTGSRLDLVSHDGKGRRKGHN